MYTVKKVLALLLAAMLLLGLAACSGAPEPTPEPAEPSAPVEEPVKDEEPAPEPAEPAAPAEEEDSVPGDTAEPVEGLTIHENTFFTVGYREEDGWTLAEDDVYASEYGGEAHLRILDEDGWTALLVRIEACEESASSFRSTLHDNNVDMQAYVEGIWVTEEIGGRSMAAVDKENGEWYFFDRDENAGVSYTVYVENKDDPRAAEILQNITFSESDEDNADPPWPWEGEPFSGDVRSQLVGPHTLTAQFLDLGDPMVTYETFDHDIAVVGDMVYLLSDCALYQYAYDGESLAFVKEIPLPGAYEIVETGANGNIVLSAFMEPVFGHDGASAQFSYEGPDKFSLAPDGTWGISWFVSGEDCELYTFQNSVLTGSPFPFAEVDTISQVCIDSQYILVSGYSKEDSEHYLFVYDYSGELQMQLDGEPDGFGLGSITYAVSTSNGFLALDANMREVVLWTADGTWLGAVDDGDLFGTNYPWLASAAMTDDGSILIIASDERADESADEVLVFKLSGF